MAIRLNLYLGSQSICIVRFGFPTMGDPMLKNPNALLFPLTESLPFSLRVVALFSQCSLPNCQPLFLPSFSYL